MVIKPDGHFFYLEQRQEDRLDVGEFWNNLTNLRSLNHDMIKGYQPAFEKARELAGEGMKKLNNE